jgi:hypothetical protein
LADTVQISNFSYVTIERKKGYPVKHLRFTLVATFGDPERAIGLDGCLAHRTIKNTLVWSPPSSMTRFNRPMKTSFVNQQVYDDVIAAIAGSEYVAEIGRLEWDDETNKPKEQKVLNV